MLNIFIMSLPFYFNNNPITYTDFLVFRTNKMIRLAVDIDFSRNTSSEPYNSYLKLSCFNINSNTISFTLLLVYQLIKSKNTTKKYYIHFNSYIISIYVFMCFFMLFHIQKYVNLLFLYIFISFCMPKCMPPYCRV
jgi:hypothetical protein